MADEFTVDPDLDGTDRDDWTYDGGSYSAQAVNLVSNKYALSVELAGEMFTNISSALTSIDDFIKTIRLQKALNRFVKPKGSLFSMGEV